MTTSTPRPKRRGGKRPGAGAPRGNTNAVKTGVHSARLHAIVRRLFTDPDFIALEHTLIQQGRHQAEARKLLFAPAVYTVYLQRARLGVPNPSPRLPFTPAAVDALHAALNPPIPSPVQERG